MTSVIKTFRQLEQWSKPYYCIAWQERDNPNAYTLESFRNSSLLNYRVFVDYGDNKELEAVTEPMPHRDAINKLKQIKLLLKDGANYDDNYDVPFKHSTYGRRVVEEVNEGFTEGI
jgi:hypothetical protein